MWCMRRPKLRTKSSVGIGRFSNELTNAGVLFAVNTRAGDFLSSSMSGCLVTFVDEFISTML
jgi:hypothetical protein